MTTSNKEKSEKIYSLCDRIGSIVEDLIVEAAEDLDDFTEREWGELEYSASASSSIAISRKCQEMTGKYPDKGY